MGRKRPGLLFVTRPRLTQHTACSPSLSESNARSRGDAMAWHTAN